MKSFTTIGLVVVFTLPLLSFSQAKKYSFIDGKIEGLTSIEELDEAAVFSFAIMSDNKGDSPSSSDVFASMVRWIEESGDAFVIGLGDHVSKDSKNDFLFFLEVNQWWHANFYPNVADGENEYYGEGPGDRGAGAPILDEVDLSSRPNVMLRKNECEYYARIEVQGYTVHLLQLHYPDTPADDFLAFPEDTRAYLINTLESIIKGKKDIIIVAAHSYDGFWLDELSAERQRIVVEKADLLLSAATNFFVRDYLPHYDESGALCINTGSITYPISFSPYGYVQVHVLEDPLILVVQCINAAKPEREFELHERAYIKAIDGPIIEARFREPCPNIDSDVVVGVFSEVYDEIDMYPVVRNLYAGVTSADDVYVDVYKGLPAGEVTLCDLWGVFPYNDEIYMLTLTAEEVENIFGERLPLKGRTEVKLAINGYQGEFLIRKHNIPEERVLRTGRHEIEILTEWVKSKE